MPSHNTQVMQRSQALDAQRRYLTNDPTPDKIAGLMVDADNGDIAAMIELDEEMEAKDAHLQDVASRRRESVTALDWRVGPETETEDKDGAELAANYCQEQLRRVRSFANTLKHLATGIGPGVAVTELIWTEGQLVKTVDIPGHRIMTDINVSNQLRIATQENQTDGEPIYSPGYIQFTPHMRAGFPIKVTITRAQAWLWVIKHFEIADWSAFSEKFGMPWSVAKWKEGARTGEQQDIEDMMKNLTADGWAVFSENIDVQMMESARGTQPFEAFIDWCERKQSILYLGQTLTTEQGNVGSLALGQVHSNVRASITLSDLANEREAIEDQMLTPMIRFRFPGRDLPIPRWERQVVEEQNLDAQRLAMEQIRLGRELGLSFDRDWAYDALKIPIPQGEPDEQIGPAATPAGRPAG